MALMEPQELRPGLYRWTAPHPDFEPDPEPDSPADWPEQVGCVAYQGPEALVFIDPLVPEELWPALDRLVEGRPVTVLTTIAFHSRSGDAVVKRYDASARLTRGVEMIRIPRAGEAMVWIPEHAALVPGDRILGGREGGLRVCPDSWLSYLPSGITGEELREALRPLLQLPIELVLVSHGEPVLAAGRDELERALSSNA
jgi:hypothetical protein